MCTCQSQTPWLSLPSTLPLITISSFSKSVSLFLFYKEICLYHFLLDFAYKWYHTVFLFILLCLTYIFITCQRLLKLCINPYRWSIFNTHSIVGVLMGITFTVMNQNPLALILSIIEGSSTSAPSGCLLYVLIKESSLLHQLSQFSSVTHSCLTLCNPMDHSTPGLPEITQTHVHWVGDVIQPSHPLLSPSPPAFNLSQHQSLFQWVTSSHQVAKVLEFQLQYQSFQWTPRTDIL